jgi:hypothetical protein
MKIKSLFLIFFILPLLTGCSAAINFQGKVAGISSGKFFYQEGNLVSEYKADIDLVWRACEKTVADLKATDVKKERKISTGVIEAVIQEEKVIIKVEYLDRDLTSVSILVGPLGNNMASRLIHDKIIGNLAKN